MDRGDTTILHKKQGKEDPKFCDIYGGRIKILPGEEATFPMPDYCLKGGQH